MAAGRPRSPLLPAAAAVSFEEVAFDRFCDLLAGLTRLQNELGGPGRRVATLREAVRKKLTAFFTTVAPGDPFPALWMLCADEGAEGGWKNALWIKEKSLRGLVAESIGVELPTSGSYGADEIAAEVATAVVGSRTGSLGGVSASCGEIWQQLSELFLAVERAGGSLDAGNEGGPRAAFGPSGGPLNKARVAAVGKIFELARCGGTKSEALARVCWCAKILMRRTGLAEGWGAAEAAAALFDAWGIEKPKPPLRIASIVDAHDHVVRVSARDNCRSAQGCWWLSCPPPRGLDVCRGTRDLAGEGQGHPAGRYAVQRKHDGWRIQAVVMQEGGAGSRRRVALFTRTGRQLPAGGKGNAITRLCTAINGAVDEMAPCAVDGELVALLNGKEGGHFEKIKNLTRPSQSAAAEGEGFSLGIRVFDLITWRGQPATEWSLLDRLRRLERGLVVDGSTRNLVQMVPNVGVVDLPQEVHRLDGMFADAVRHQWEGLVVKHLTDNDVAWLKLKKDLSANIMGLGDTLDVAIVGFVDRSADGRFRGQVVCALPRKPKDRTWEQVMSTDEMCGLPVWAKAGEYFCPAETMTGRRNEDAQEVIGKKGFKRATHVLRKGKEAMVYEVIWNEVERSGSGSGGVKSRCCRLFRRREDKSIHDLRFADDYMRQAEKSVVDCDPGGDRRADLEARADAAKWNAERQRLARLRKQDSGATPPPSPPSTPPATPPAAHSSPSSTLSTPGEHGGACTATAVVVAHETTKKRRLGRLAIAVRAAPRVGLAVVDGMNAKSAASMVLAASDGSDEGALQAARAAASKAGWQECGAGDGVPVYNLDRFLSTAAATRRGGRLTKTHVLAHLQPPASKEVDILGKENSTG